MKSALFVDFDNVYLGSSQKTDRKVR